jgi:hypothetical protein
MAPPPWLSASPGEIERSLDAQGYGLIAPLVRRPGIYLTDVVAGPAGYQRLVIDARSGQIVQRFVAPGHMWGPALAARGEGFGEPVPGEAAPSWGPGFSNAPGAYRGPGSMHIPASGPYGAGEAPVGTKLKPKLALTERTTNRLPANPPLPPPAPREAAALPTAPNIAVGASEKPKVTVVPPALFE